MRMDLLICTDSDEPTVHTCFRTRFLNYLYSLTVVRINADLKLLARLKHDLT
jgi:hypothetical protein